MVDIGEAESIEERLKEFGRRIAGNAGEFPRHFGRQDFQSPSLDFLDIGNSLTDQLLRPVLALLGDKDRIFIAPDGALSLLSFEALPLGSDHLVIDDYRLSYLGTGRDILRSGEVESTTLSAPIVLAGPDYDLSLPDIPAATAPPRETDGHTLRSMKGAAGLELRPLPGAAAEGREVAALLNCPRMITGADAVEAEVRSWRSPILVHLATHGFYLPDASDTDITGVAHLQADGAMIASGLALAGTNTWFRGGSLPKEAEDGILTAEDAATLNLIGTELVVLSACVSGIGSTVPGEGVFGLRRAFFVAGARSLVMSLWQVPDVETKELMVTFYQALREGKPKPEALRDAKLSLRKRFPHPFYWASFVCEGDWQPVSAGAFC